MGGRGVEQGLRNSREHAPVRAAPPRPWIRRARETCVARALLKEKSSRTARAKLEGECTMKIKSNVKAGRAVGTAEQQGAVGTAEQA